MKMANKIPISEKFMRAARAFPTPLYLVGGTVRNALLGLPAGDEDAASALDADRAAECFAAAGFAVKATYPRLGTLKLRNPETGESVEYTRFRTESYAVGGAHAPREVRFTEDLAADARRRDFRINAIYYDVAAGTVVDPLDGQSDLAARTILCADDADRVFAADGLRLLRLVRFCAELGFDPAPETLAAAYRFRDNLDEIVPERVAEELRKIAFADCRYGVAEAHYRGFLLLDELGLLDKVLPEIAAGRGMPQRADFHRYDVLGHTLHVFRVAPPAVRLAALLHDVGKPVCYRATGLYHGHEAVSGELAGEIARRAFGCSKREADQIARLCALHMVDLKCEMRENKRKRFIAEHDELIENLLLLKQADYFGCGLRTGECPTVARFRRTLADMREKGTPLRPADLAISGRDVAERLPDLPQSRIGEVLDALWKTCVCDERQNEREKLLARLDRLAERRAAHAARASLTRPADERIAPAESANILNSSAGIPTATVPATASSAAPADAPDSSNHSTQ